MRAHLHSMTSAYTSLTTADVITTLLHGQSTYTWQRSVLLTFSSHNCNNKIVVKIKINLIKSFFAVKMYRSFKQTTKNVCEGVLRVKS